MNKKGHLNFENRALKIQRGRGGGGSALEAPPRYGTARIAIVSIYLELNKTVMS